MATSGARQVWVENPMWEYSTVRVSALASKEDQST